MLIQLIVDTHTFFGTHSLIEDVLEILTLWKGISVIHIYPQAFFQDSIGGPFLKFCYSSHSFECLLNALSELKNNMHLPFC